jgi:DNA-binding response OmpR family regulator
VPIIIVSARGEEVDRVLGLEMGADDYVVKPFSLKELAARCRVALRRSDATTAPVDSYRDENFEVEFDAFLVRYRGEEVRLTPKEFELFRYLVERRGRVVTRERLLSEVWGYDADVETAASTPTSAGCASSWAPPATTSRRSWASATGSCPSRPPPPPRTAASRPA